MKQYAFFLGKGGVGKTSLSAAFALGLARQGRRVLAVSIDPAHNLGDVYGMTLADAPREVEPGLSAAEIDVAAWVRTYLDESLTQMKASYGYASTLNIDSFFNILKHSPGTEEYAVLWALEHIHDTFSSAYDVIVIDTPPTALSMRFLAMPSISQRWVRELSKLRERILCKRQTIAKLNPDSPMASGCVDAADDAVSLQLNSIQKRLAKLNSIFLGDSFMSVVINTDELSVSEAERIRSDLGELRIELSSVCINKRGMSSAPWQLDNALSGLPLFYFDFMPSGLHGRDDLARIGTSELIRHFCL